MTCLRADGSIIDDVVVREMPLQFAAEFLGFDFGFELRGEKLEAATGVEFLEELLLEGTAFAEVERGDVGERVDVLDALEKLGHALRRRRAEAAAQVEQAHDFDAFDFELRMAAAGGAGEGAHGGEAVGVFAYNMLDFDAADSLQEEIGGVAVGLLAGANNADAGDGIGGLHGARLGGQDRIEAGDGEEAVAREHIAQHLPVARLEDMQREQRLRKEDRFRQRHHRHRVGHMQHFHAANETPDAEYTTADRKSPPQPGSATPAARCRNHTSRRRISASSVWSGAVLLT